MTDYFYMIYLYNMTIKNFLTYQLIYALYRQNAQKSPYRHFFYVVDKIYHKYIKVAKKGLKTSKKGICEKVPPMGGAVILYAIKLCGGTFLKLC